jgi:hypothetical protein
MRKLFLLILCTAIMSICFAQTRFIKDTLYTESGFKIYKGQTLQLGDGSGKGGSFRFVKQGSESVHTKFKNCKVEVLEMGKLKVSSLQNAYIHLTVRVFYKDGTHTKEYLKLNFNKAINSNDGFPSEMIVPDEFKK